MGVTLDQPDVKPAAEKRCGNLDALRPKIMPLKGAARTDALTKACNIEGVKGSDEVTAFAVLAAALVQDELAAQPETTAEEKVLAVHLRRLCVPDPE